MILPNNGSVLVLDDKIDEALPLIQALSKQKVPVIYYDGLFRNLPKTPLNGIRVVFSDMKYTEVNDDRNTVTKLIQILKTIISKDNGPYILIVWSKHDAEYLQDFKNLLSEQNDMAQPVFVLNMEKSKYFETVPSDNLEQSKSLDEICSTIENLQIANPEDIIIKIKDILKQDEPTLKKRLIHGGLGKIEKKLKLELDKAGVFNLFFIWESLVNTSSYQTINHISSLNVINEKWNENTEALLSRIAEATLGRKNVKTNKDLVRGSLLALADMLIENTNVSIDTLLSGEELEVMLRKQKYLLKETITDCEYTLYYESYPKEYILKQDGNEIFRIQFDKIKDLTLSSNNEKVFSNLYNNYLKNQAELNSKLLLHMTKNNIKQPGNVYKINADINKKRAFSSELFLKDNNPFNLKETEYSDIEYIELEVSPDCDYAQKKWELNRIIPGFIVPQKYFDILKTEGQYLYVTPSLLLNGQVVKIILNYRLFCSYPLNYLDDKTIMFKLNQSLVTKIKNELGFHILRSGITEMFC